MYFPNYFFLVINQIVRIFEVVGYPSDDYIDDMELDKRNFIATMNKEASRVNFKEYFHYIQNSDGSLIFL